MPRIDPITGVPCMTLQEFWKQEAQSEGKEPAEVMSDFYDDLIASMQQEEAKLESDPASALKTLQEYYNPEYCEDVTFSPEEVLRVWDAHVSYRSRSDGTSFKCEVRCSDGKIRKLQVSEWSSGGSYYEPPDYQIECQEIKE
jgi:hypothetical protein